MASKDEFMKAWDLYKMPLPERFTFLQYSQLRCYCWEITSRADEHVSVCPAAPENRGIVEELLRECRAEAGAYQFDVPF
jgi:hypothetical protein